MAALIDLRGSSWALARKKAAFLDYKIICENVGQPLP
jgi:hypothetical protein